MTTYSFPPEHLPRSPLWKRRWAGSHLQIASGSRAAGQPVPICGQTCAAAARDETNKAATASPMGFHRSSVDADDCPASAPSCGHPPAAKSGARHLAQTGLFFVAGKSTEMYRRTACLWRISGILTCLNNVCLIFRSGAKIHKATYITS